MEYHVGDKLICRVSSDELVIFDVDFNDRRYLHFKTKSFEVIGLHNKRFYILLVSAATDSAFELTDDTFNLYKIDRSHKGRYAYIIRENAVGVRQKIDFYRDARMCCVCKQYIPYAEPNQADGRFACWSCKTDERYKLIHNIK